MWGDIAIAFLLAFITAWTYVLLGIAAFITIIKWGIEIADKSK